MKWLTIIFPFFLVLFSGGLLHAQKSTVTETFKVRGNCEMCKRTIEHSARNAGAKFAVWDMESHLLTVRYKVKKTSKDRIQKAIAAAGYDTPLYTADDEAYEHLHACCKYDRNKPLD